MRWLRHRWCLLIYGKFARAGLVSASEVRRQCLWCGYLSPEFPR